MYSARKLEIWWEKGCVYEQTKSPQWFINSIHKYVFVIIYMHLPRDGFDVLAT